ncbi:MAG: DUF255 domain-containing protein [Candidatus Anammoximicrobium sp.]|nr:DUF255 domain-containing protein [Candidatus Anammoximicrobium sp.]
MRQTIRLSLVGTLLAIGATPGLAQSGIPWLYDIGEAQQIARREQRLLLLHFYSDTCAPCRRLEQNVFPNPEVYRAMSQSYIPVKINGERARGIAVQYQVDRWPTDVIADPQGRILYKTVSPQDPGRYVQLLNAVAADFRALGPPAPVAASAPPQGGPGVADPYAGYGRQVDSRSQFAAYAPPAPNASWGNSYAPTAPAPTGTPPNPVPREQINPYAESYQAASTAGAAPLANTYDPRSSWTTAEPEPSGSDSAYGVSGPAIAPAQGGNPSGQPAWQENRSVSGRAADEPGGAAAASQTAASGGLAGVPLTLDGFCAVTLAEQERWVKGDPRWGAVHRGRTYLFLSEQHQRRFLADPDRYSPVLSGYDPARYVDRGELVPGQRRHGMWYRGRIYLFADEESLERFSASPDIYAQRVHEIMMAAGRN